MAKIFGSLMGRKLNPRQVPNLIGSGVKSAISIFKPRALRSTADNPSFRFNQMADMNGATITVGASSNSANIAAANTQRSILAYELDTSIQALVTTSTNPVYVHWDTNWYIQSTAPFGACFWIALMENGETITPADYNGSNLMAAVEATQAAQDHTIVLGPINLASLVKDGGNQWVAHIGMDLTALANAYAQHYARKHMEEQNALQLKLGCTFVGVASQAFTYQDMGSKSYNLEPKEML